VLHRTDHAIPGEDIDWTGLDRLIDFQIQNGVTGILAVGTTGESRS